MRHRRNPGPFAHITLSQELDGLAAYMAGLDEDERDEFDFYDEIRPILTRHLGRPLGPSADWVNPTWRLGGDLYLFEGDYDDFDVVFRVPADDPDEADVIEDVENLADFAALRRYFRMRRNPRRKAPSRKGAGREYLIDGEHATFEALLRDNQDDEDFIEALLALDVGESMAWGPGHLDERMTGWGQATFEIERIPAASERHNPRRKAPPPPPSHTFALGADPYQQGLFATSSYEAKQKKRAPEPVVDERQVDLFAPPPPPKKNPRANPTCPKCGGTGKLYAFRHVEKGTCFRCGGTGEVDKLTPAEKGQADPPPPTGSYGVRISSEDYNAILPGYSSFEEANRTRKALAEEHKDATYTVVKFDGKEWRTRSGERANPRRRR